MIEFHIREEKRRVEVEWIADDPHKQAFLFFEPLTPIKIVKDRALQVEEKLKDSVPVKEISKSSLPQPIPFSLPGNATWRFSLYGSMDKKDGPFMECEAYIGRHIPIKLERSPYRKGFEQISIRCQYKLNAAHFWLSFKGMEEKGKFYLPPVKDVGDWYTTSCLLKEGAYGRLVPCLDPSVADCIQIKN